MLVVAGIPFSGKSAYIEQVLKAECSGFLYISFDDIMQRLSIYKELVKSHGSQAAFEQCELLARVVGYELLHRAVETKLSIVFEHSSTPSEHVELYRVIQGSFGYQVEMRVLDVSLETAAQRAKRFNGKRDDNRHTPEHYLEERHKRLQKLLPEYEALMPVNRIVDTG